MSTYVVPREAPIHTVPPPLRQPVPTANVLLDPNSHLLLIMVKSTLVVRASDALPLAASVDDEQVASQLSSSSVNVD